MAAEITGNDRVLRDLGVRVALLRRLRGLTQKEVGEKIGLTRSSIANIEAGRQNVPIDQVIALAKVFETTIMELFGESDAAQRDLSGWAELAKRLAQSLATYRQLADEAWESRDYRGAVEFRERVEGLKIAQDHLRATSPLEARTPDADSP